MANKAKPNTWFYFSKLRTIKSTRCINFSILFWDETLHVSDSSFSPSSGVFHCIHSNGIGHTGLRTAFKQYQDHPDPACKLFANHCCVYSDILLMMDRGTVRNM